MPKKIIIALIGFFLLPVHVSSQEETMQEKGQSESDSSEGVLEAEAEEGIEHSAQRDELLDSFRGMVEVISKQQEQIEELINQVESLNQRVEDAEQSAFEKEVQEAQALMEPGLDIYGFLATGFGKTWLPKNSPLEGAMLNKSYFSVTDLNLYLSSNLNSTFFALMELGFTFLPNGVEASLVPYERIDTTVTDPRSSKQVALGGVYIQRAFISWTPRDYFSITLGRFLTPYGIWHLDHGATVIPTIAVPYLVNRASIPRAQTGIMLSGKFFPVTNLIFDYALTLSNGRGPAENVYDLNENKAIGLRLRLSYEQQAWGMAFGGYGFYAKNNDIDKVISGVNIVVEDIQRYSEMAGSLDLSLRVGSFKLQSEFVRSLIKYEVRPLRNLPGLNIGVPGQYQPDYYQWDLYLLATYDFLYKKGEMNITFTPWVMAERSVLDDTYPDTNIDMLSAGLAVKPRPYLALKVSGMMINFPDSDFLSGYVWGINTQAAVSF